MVKHSVKEKLFLALSGALALLLILWLLLSFVFMVPAFYKDNKTLESEANREIKALTLDFIKSQHSTFFSSNKYKPAEVTASSEKCLFVSINRDFMDSVTGSYEAGRYNVEVQLFAPDDWLYYITIEIVNGQYAFSDYAISP